MRNRPNPFINPKNRLNHQGIPSTIMKNLFMNEMSLTLPMLNCPAVLSFTLLLPSDTRFARPTLIARSTAMSSIVKLVTIKNQKVTMTANAKVILATKLKGLNPHLSRLRCLRIP